MASRASSIPDAVHPEQSQPHKLPVTTHELARAADQFYASEYAVHYRVDGTAMLMNVGNDRAPWNIRIGYDGARPYAMHYDGSENTTLTRALTDIALRLRAERAA